MTLWLRKRPANYDGDRHSAPTSSQAGELRIAREESVSSGDRTRAEQIRILYRTGPVGVVGAAVAAVVLAGLLQSLGSSALLGTEVWLACLVLVVAGHLALCRRYWRAAPADTAWRPWARWFTLFSAAEGTIWGVASMSLTTLGAGAPDHDIFDANALPAKTYGNNLCEVSLIGPSPGQDICKLPNIAGHRNGPVDREW
jgi:hypothetical protein